MFKNNLSVIFRSLRIYPPVSFISRDLGADMIINNVLFYKGSIVHIHIFDLHRDPEVFPDPEKFDPDRFLPENCIKRHPYAYVPFSAGKLLITFTQIYVVIMTHEYFRTEKLCW